MIRGDLSATGILNAVVPHLRRVAAPAAGVLLLTSLPLRLLQVHFLDLLDRLRGDAPHYGNLLIAVSSLTVASLIVSLYGRAVFMRACHHAPQSWRDLFRIDLRSFLTYVYAALVIEIALVLFSPILISIPLAIVLAGVAAVASADAPRPGLVAPLRALSPYLGHGRVLAGLMFVFTMAFVAVCINLYYVVGLIAWASTAVPGFDAVRWAAAFRGHRFPLALIVAAIAVLEPFFLTAMYVYAGRVRSRQSGEDLLRRFKVLTSRKAVAAALVVGFLLCVPARAQERTITTPEYTGQLRVVRDALAGKRFPDAQSAAADLESVRWIVTPATRFEPDRALLRSARESAAESKPDLAVVDRLTSTIEALGGGGLKTEPGIGDKNLLDRIRQREKAGELLRGGDLKELPAVAPTIGDEVARVLKNVIEWLAAKLERLFDWIIRMWPSRHERDEDRASFLGVPVIVWVVTLLIVGTLLLLAAYVLRRSRRRALPVISTEAVSSERDADPLSRESNEWERYAAELAASGRLREAIRAWYHAVLVTLYRAGILHYRKGITNWEYVSALSPALEWRPQFVSMTRQFDREWYGRRETTADVLDSCVADARVILVALQRGGR